MTRDNAEHLADLVDMAVYLGNVGGIGLDLLRMTGRAEDGETGPAEAETLRLGLLRLKERLDAVNRLLERPLVVREFEKAACSLGAKKPCRDYCYAARGEAMAVLPQGDCYPCGSLAGRPEYYMGNVHSTVRPLRIGCARPERCGACVYREACSGGCPSRGILCGGFDELDCLMKKISFQFAQSRW